MVFLNVLSQVFINVVAGSVESEIAIQTQDQLLFE